MEQSQKKWWKEGVVYQIYPRSFMDSNGDGLGDIRGIIQKLDYIKSLGVDIIWLCPVYESPQDDNGYDISDYYSIFEVFGSMDDFDELLYGIHSRGMKLVMDLVVNHTSDEHAWFIESKASLDNPKRDYYIWRDGKNGAPPNNWKAFFGGSVWQYDEQTDQYFLHFFSKRQPDLNWENPEVRNEIYKLMKFWLDKGIDGYRMDVISLISKREFEDTPFAGFNETIEKLYANGPKIHEYLREMNREVLSKYDIMTVGEGPGISLQHGIEYVQADRKELDMVFHFDHMFIDHGAQSKFEPVKYDLVRFKEVFTHWDKIIEQGGWNSIFLGNHDYPRIVSRFGNDQQYREKSAKALALLLLTLRGTTYIYQGDELGMTNVRFGSIDQYRDIETLNAYQEAVENGADLEKMMAGIHWQSRDNARTPMQWDDSENAGFTSGTPWISLNPNYPSINSQSQEGDPDSVLNFYRKAIAFRKQNPVLVYGEYEVIDVLNPRVFAYWRYDDQTRLLVVINFTEDTIPFEVAGLNNSNKIESLLSNEAQPSSLKEGIFMLKPWEAGLYKIST